MFNKLNYKEPLKIYSIIFIIISIFLTLFSIIYADIYSVKITGFTPYPINRAPSAYAVENAGPLPEEIISNIKEIVKKVSQNADRASKITEIVESTTISEGELIAYNEELKILGLESANYFFTATFSTTGYLPSEETQQDLNAILADIGIISTAIQRVDKIISEKVENYQEIKKNLDSWSITREGEILKSSEKLFEYIKKVKPIQGEEKTEPLQSPPSIANLFGQTEEKCSYPTILAAFDNSLTDFGSQGINPETGEVCKIEKQIFFDASTGSLNLKSFTIPDLNIPQEIKPILKEKSIRAFNFEEKSPFLSPGKSANENVGIVMYEDDNELLNIRFFSSTDYKDIEEKMSKFVYSLFFKEKDDSKITGMTLEEAESIIKENNSIPWLIWIILIVMIAGSIFIESFFVQNPQIITNEKNSPNRIISSSSRVEKMITDSLNELKTDPKIAKTRMPLIASEYEKLNKKEKENLASLYESLVYKIKNLFK